MTDVLFARWTCAECGRKGVVSGERADTTAQEPGDPAPFNCYYCQSTVTVPLPPGLDRWHLRVEGEHVPDAPLQCLQCRGGVSAYWDERDTPLVICETCGLIHRVPEPAPDPSHWEMLLESREEKIERRKVPGGWEYRSESYYKEGSRLRPVRRATTLEGFEPDPGRPLSQIFKDIRAEHVRLREQAALPPAAPRPEPAAEQPAEPPTEEE
jgi:hypothetical protein